MIGESGDFPDQNLSARLPAANHRAVFIVRKRSGYDDGMVAPNSDDPIAVKLPADIGVRVAAAAREQRRTPDELVAEACRRLLTSLEAAGLDEQYQRGYEQTPEDTSDVEALLPHLPLPEED
jgi:hypothetical protein